MVMQFRPTLAVGLIAAVCLAVALAGCGGGSDGVPTAGAVYGHVVDFQSQSGIGGTVITVGGQQATSGQDGYFLVRSVGAGSHTVLVSPPTGFVLAPGSPVITAQVVGGQTTVLPNDIVLFDPTDLPPSPPG